MTEKKAVTEKLCPTCNGRGKIKIPDECKIVDCPRTSKYYYENPVSGASGEYCERHLNQLNPDMSVEDWLDQGFAFKLSEMD